MRPPPARRSRWPYYRSAGHRLFSLRLALSRGSGWSNGLERDSKFVEVTGKRESYRRITSTRSVFTSRMVTRGS